MMSFKSFMQTQDDSISDEEGIKKYAEYKLEFKRQQLNEFFVTHKEEEWFKQKYHPEDCFKRKEELKSMLLKRVELFQEFNVGGKFNGLALDGDKQDALIKVLDSVVIKLEGGTDFDLTILDYPDEEDKRLDDGDRDREEERGKKRKREKSRDKKEDDKKGVDEENTQLMKKSKEFLQSTDNEDKNEEEIKKEVKEESNKKDTKMSDDEDSEATKKDEMADTQDTCRDEDDDSRKRETTETEDEVKEEEKKNSDEKETDKDMKKEEAEEEEEDDDETKSKKEFDSDSEEEKNKEPPAKPRSLHKTMSIFLRNLAPTITKHEVEAMCKRYDGFLRAAIAEPAPDRRWFRRGWVTFRRDVKIKDICFNLNNIRLKDCELGPIVNRDLTRRIRTVPGLTCDKKVVRNDIKLAAKIITNLDNKWGLWQAEESDHSIGLSSSNPLLANITDYLIEEASAEEEELLGRGDNTEQGEEGQQGITITRDDDLICVLDKMILYLRIVHSVDFYNHSEYPNEDEMPNRCGILHARGIPPPAKVTSQEVEEYMKTFEKKMGGFLVVRGDLTPEEAAKFGLKVEVDEA